MANTLFPEFRDQVSPTRYPFIDTASLQAGNGTALDLDMFLDAGLYLIGNVGAVHLSRIDVAVRSVTLSVSSQNGRQTATAQFDPTVPPDELPVYDAAGRASGLLVSEAARLSRFSAWLPGTYTFTPAATTFVAGVVIPVPDTGVRGIVTDTGQILTGDVWLAGDNGIVFREEDGDMRMDVVGDPLFLRRLCDPLDLFRVPRFVRTINGCPPDRFGNYNLTVGEQQNPQTILRIYATRDGLTIEAVGQLVGRG